MQHSRLKKPGTLGNYVQAIQDLNLWLEQEGIIVEEYDNERKKQLEAAEASSLKEAQEAAAAHAAAEAARELARAADMAAATAAAEAKRLEAEAEAADAGEELGEGEGGGAGRGVGSGGGRDGGLARDAHARGPPHLAVLEQPR